jgi:hypothetical protein
MARNIIYTQEFPPELAGQRVGWTSVEEAPDNNDLVVVNAVAATVGTDGARHGFIELDNGERRIRFPSNDTSEGFVAVSGLSVTISKERGIHHGNISYAAEGSASGGSWSILENGVSGYTKLAPGETQKRWVDSTQVFIADLRQGMSKHGVIDHYPVVYYSLNGYMGHEGYRSRDSNPYSEPAELFIPDATMVGETGAQVSVIDTVVRSLEAAKTESENMKRCLTVFSDVPAEDIPNTFRASRRTVAEQERRALGASAQIHAVDLAYLPIGTGQSGRTWAYMDALATTEHEAFGRELEALLAKDTGRARRELERELSELEARITYARQGRQVMRLLNIAESEQVVIDLNS